MWVMTPIGFFSIVEKPDDVGGGTLTIRARVRADLELLRERFMPTLSAISADAGTDYRYRAKASREAVAESLARLAKGIDYSNFKAAVATRQGKARAAAYGRVWEVLYGLSESESDNKPIRAMNVSTKKRAFGGVLVDDRGRILLREPRDHYDGYVWTFPKGRPDEGETPEQAALREVREETGLEAIVIRKLPRGYAGSTSITEMFLMRPVGRPGPFDGETAAVEWVLPEEAAARIALTKNPAGRNRDLKILADARKEIEAGL